MIRRLLDFCSYCQGALRAAGWAWWWFRQVSGDAAYENYLRSAAAAKANLQDDSPSRPLLSREEFFLEGLRRRYTGVSRCC